MRGFALMVLGMASVAALIPWPRLLPVSLVILAAIWLLTPAWERAIEPGSEGPGNRGRERG